MLDMSVQTETPGKSGLLVCYKHWRLPIEEVRQRKSVAAMAMLADAYQCRRSGKRPVCSCIGGDGLELEARKFAGGLPFLARWRRQRRSHTPICPFSSPSHAGEIERVAAVRLANGGLSFKVRVSLEPKDEDSPAPPNSISNPSGAAAVTRSSVELTGMLDDAFEFLQFDRHRAGTVRTHASVMEALRDLASKSELNHRAMAEFVHFAANGDVPEAWHQRLLKLKQRKRGRQRCLVVVGEISRVQDARDGVDILLHGIDAPFALTGEMHSEVRSQYRSAWLRARARNIHGESRVFAMLVVALGNSGSIEVRRCCVRVLSRQYILCDSFNEVLVAIKLIALRRSFCKPLSPAAGEIYRPDFELLDVGRRWIMEVWGRDDQTYLERKSAKILYWIDDTKAKLWQWNVLSKTRITPFPPKQNLVRHGRFAESSRIAPARQLESCFDAQAHAHVG